VNPAVEKLSTLRANAMKARPTVPIVASAIAASTARFFIGSRTAVQQSECHKPTCLIRLEVMHFQ
jgi:hypothetical protein